MEEILKPSRNCWQQVNARRAAFIVDGEAYFRALHESFRRARRSIFIVGWDLHSDVRLIRNEDDGADSVKLGAYLDRLASARKELHVYLLSWDFAMIYAMEREFFPRYKLKWRTHKRIHFCLDGHHPVGASQHQKIVVVDDAVAFVGGLDLSQWRWDTPDHLLEDNRRTDPDGKPYPPFHDVQMAVDDSAAVVLGELVRERWTLAVGKKPFVMKSAPDKDDVWPPDLKPDLENVQVAVARTLPAYGDRSAVREVEQLYLDGIAAAERFIYIENQYFSSHRIGQALRGRLKAHDGPEVVIVLPEKSSGWLEHYTMDVLRARLLESLRKADEYSRLRVYYPRISETPHCGLMVHSKVMVIDEAFVRIGSSNLSNRSMGLDSECDLAVAAGSDNAIRSAIARFRNRLIAEHSGVKVHDVEAALEKTGSLINAIESLRSRERTLVPLSGCIPPEVDRWVPESVLLDPERPVSPNELVDYFVSPEQQSSAYRHLVKVILLIAVVILMAALWRWTPAGDWIDLASLRTAGDWIRKQPLTPIWIPAAYVVAGMAAFPVTLLIIATVLVFGPWQGFFYALSGAELSAVAVFAIGRCLGRDAVRRFAGSLINRLSRKLSASGMKAVITFRIVPVAPFSVINLIAGVSEIRFRDFALGTFVGMLPGVTATVLLADRIYETFRMPDLGHFATMAGAVVLVAAGLFALRRWLRSRRDGQERDRRPTEHTQ
ncbi:MULTISPECIES: VTT domain-containing protein [Desulfococcus]|uniref:SNARE associated protein n=1 Tax=Desulfococcus multivorans DSM 2059 TaxID=1121405 RepID=S7V746_DESML|nr:VTT domain-containing protein [Desulfococcus multivorans]AOY58257.1 phospholipase D [Desulfococcus multivorans]AQV00601.1 hypothetical protein B2D07_07345 [Desulfococcus multivorans]EPR42489.1 SNARE associated protein [Desulfococcus multivorans DSM 2059]SJZ97606.1 Phosphatidylserine/phosphatidylglycerophosphate/cardiolipin synthase [Desulfococcus multivorans DSM 2059]